ncbi:MAG: hypothetical protein CMN30_31610 [Sandaracinus sp.]|nr:hypothetical protein [Sandaracinus sp.]|tara:strand:- start:2312 stop:3472 length:1161 start_codon:yes stop_codon:yes gene_type:complete
MPEIRLKSARTSETDPVAAAEDLLSQIGSVNPKMVTVFADRSVDQKALNAALRERLGDGVKLLGATAARQIDDDGMHDGMIVLGAFEGDLEVGVGIGRGLSDDAFGAGSEAMKMACQQLGTRPQDLDIRHHVGIVIDDGFRYKKEELLLGALDRNQGLILIGGGASDAEQDPEKQSAEVHVDGEVETDAVLVAMIKTEAPFAALRHHAYRPTGDSLVITKVSDDGNRAIEIDGQPAAQRYADLLGVTVDDLEFGLPNGFARMPLALKVGREYFLRSPWKPLPDGSILFANLLEEDSTLELMTYADTASLTEEFLEKIIPEKVPNPTAAIHFHCSGRQWFADALGQTEALAEAMKKGPPSVGFNVFFEVYCGFHINTTLTSLVFGSR